MSLVTIIETDVEFKQKTASGVVVVDFFATWCGPCNVIAPKIDDLAAKHKTTVKFYKVDVDKSQDIAKNCSISAMPTFLVYKDGKLRNTIIGANLASVTSAVNALAGEPAAEPANAKPANA